MFGEIYGRTPLAASQPPAAGGRRRPAAGRPHVGGGLERSGVLSALVEYLLLQGGEVVTGLQPS